MLPGDYTGREREREERGEREEREPNGTIFYRIRGVLAGCSTLESPPFFPGGHFSDSGGFVLLCRV